jgi:hypothetical protein
MNCLRKMTLLWATFSLLTACTTGLAQDMRPPVDVSGTWSILSDNEFGHEAMKTVEIQQQGNQLRGYFKGPKQSGPISGFVDGKHIFFTTHTRFEMNFRGRVDGNTISGRWGVRGKTGTWTATRLGAPNPG